MIEQLNHFCKGTFISYLGIEFLNYGENFIEASMPVDNKLQPMGLLHGGASLALAETIASGGVFFVRKILKNMMCLVFRFRVTIFPQSIQELCLPALKLFTKVDRHMFGM